MNVPSASSKPAGMTVIDSDTELAWPPADDPRFAVDVLDLQTRRVLTVQEAARELDTTASVDAALHSASHTGSPVNAAESLPITLAGLTGSERFDEKPPVRPRAFDGIGRLSTPVLLRALLVIVIVQAIVITLFLLRGRALRAPVPAAKSAAEARTPTTPQAPAAISSSAAVPQATGVAAAATRVPPPAAEGRLLVRSDPPGAVVSIDGLRRGTAPLTIADVGPGSHRVQLSAGSAIIEQMVTIEAGTTISLVVPIQSAAAPSAWVNIGAPIDLRIFENGRAIGTSADGPLRLAAGTHKLQLVNEALGYRGEQTVTVRAGEMARLRPVLPDGVLHVNAQPWANVWVDGESVGETPLANIKVALGRHEIRFRHPSLGEQVRQVVVSASEPARISVNMKP